MERPSLATFSDSSYFDERGAHGCAQPITEFVNVGTEDNILYLLLMLTFYSHTQDP